MMHVMGIDIGTTTISIVLLHTENGELIGRKTVANHSFCQGEFPESRLQDPEKIWALTCAAVEELTGKYGKPCGIGMTGQMHGMLYVDSDGAAVSPLYTWQDGSGSLVLENGQTCVQYLKERAGNAAAGYGITTHCYLQRTGRIPKEAVKMVTISDYIAMRLTGAKETVISADMAASWGCFDLARGAFQLDLLRGADVDVSYLPSVCRKEGIIARTADRIPVIGSIGDNQASVLGTVQNMQDTVLINVGTGSQVSMGTSGYLECGGNIELRPCPPEGYIMAGSSLCGGRAYAMLEQFYREASGGQAGDMYGPMLKQAEEFLQRFGKDRAWKIDTAFSGTRKDPLRCGRMEGIDTENFHPGAMTVGMIAGILEELYGYYEEMCRISGRRARQMVGSGNGLRKNPLMRRLAEERFGMTMKIPVFEEEAACGAALYAMAEVGAAGSLEEAQRKISYIKG